jgi:hypothetical protein
MFSKNNEIVKQALKNDCSIEMISEVMTMVRLL